MTYDAAGQAEKRPLCPETPSQPFIDYLTACIRSLPRSVLPPGHGHIVLSAIFSPPRVAKVLFPWAHLDHPRAVAQGPPSNFPKSTVQTWEEMVFFHAEWRTDEEHEDDAKMIMAIEAYNYTLPDHASQVFYLSKLDTTGWGPKLVSPKLRKHLASVDVPAGVDTSAAASSSTSVHQSSGMVSSLTSYLTACFLTYFMDLRHLPRLPVECRPIRHVSLHLLARAQGAYIFPNSPDNPLKKPLSDTKLIVWWREVLSQVIERVKSARAETKQNKRIDAYYMVPGFERLESHPHVPLVLAKDDSALVKADWKYGHPSMGGVSGIAPPLPLFLDEASSSSSCPRPRTLATLLPRFEDDPQSRFMDELAGEAQGVGAVSDLFRPIEGVPHGSVNGSADQNGDAVATTKVEDTIVDSTLTNGHVKPEIQTDSAVPQTPSKRMKRSLSGVLSPSRGQSSDGESRSNTPTRSSSRRRSMTPSSRAPLALVGAHAVGHTNGTSATPPRMLRSPSKRCSPVKVEGETTPRASSKRPSPAKPIGPAAMQRSYSSSSSCSSTTTPSGPSRLNQTQLAALRSRLSLDSVSPDEFWIRMGFRQECSSGNLVGVFFVGVTVPEEESGAVLLAKEMDLTLSTSSTTNRLVIPPHVRPRFTIPLPTLQKTMRNELQLDDCYWNRDRDSVELTQYFDEERGRLLCHLGRLSDSEAGKEAVMAREGILLPSTTAAAAAAAASQKVGGEGEADQATVTKAIRLRPTHTTFTSRPPRSRSRSASSSASLSPTKRSFSTTTPSASASTSTSTSPSNPLPLTASGVPLGTTTDMTDRKKKKKSKDPSEDEDWIWRVGRGVVWSSVECVGCNVEDMERAKTLLLEEEAKERARKEGLCHGGTNGNGSTNYGNSNGPGRTSGGVTMLSVKRKGKPEA